MRSKSARNDNETAKPDNLNYAQAFAEMTRLNKQGDQVHVLKKINHSSFKVIPRPKLNLKKAPAA
jgi:hypothetical protein